MLSKAKERMSVSLFDSKSPFKLTGEVLIILKYEQTINGFMTK